MRNVFLPLIFLAAPIGHPASAQISYQGALDVVFVVEDAASMRRVDQDRTAPAALTAFAGSLPTGTRLAVVLFASGAELVKGLESKSSPGLVVSLSDALHLARYRGRLHNLPAGVERAMYELRENGRGDAKKIILIVCSSRSTSGTSTPTAESTRWLLSGLMDEAKRNGVRIFVTVLGNEADFRIPQTLALATGGSYFRASNAAALPAVLPKVIDNLTPPAATIGTKREPAPSTVVPPRTPYWLWLLSITAILLASIALGIVFQSRFGPRTPTGTHTEVVESLNNGLSSISELRERGGAALKIIAAVSHLIHSLEDELNVFQSVATECVIAANQSAEETEERYSMLIDDCIQTVDFLEIMSRQETLTEDTSVALVRALKKVAKILEHAQITEIPVECGMPFDNATQEYGTVADRGEPYGAVTKVERKGYRMTSPSRGNVILRPARVEVSCRPATPQGANRTT
jgi:molecular chaperone GrpE (heat shock protein)